MCHSVSSLLVHLCTLVYYIDKTTVSPCEFFASLFMHHGQFYLERDNCKCQFLNSLRVCLCTLVYYIDTDSCVIL